MKDFDMVPHRRLLVKLQSYDICSSRTAPARFCQRTEVGVEQSDQWHSPGKCSWTALVRDVYKRISIIWVHFTSPPLHLLYEPNNNGVDMLTYIHDLVHPPINYIACRKTCGILSITDMLSSIVAAYWVVGMGRVVAPLSEWQPHSLLAVGG